MIYELSQKFFFEAAHTLNRNIDAAGSRRIHGHTYHAEVTLIGVPDAKSGMLQDLGIVRRHIETVREMLDHQFLDDVEGLGPATLENLSKFIFTHLVSSCPHLVAVAVERPASGDKCVLRKERKAEPPASATIVETHGPLAMHA
ncbi:6-carboxytetrahydropterin synthase [Variovorax sp. J22R133]|uniref:6-carboxytetrahydropterin synthase n=1 Tax=Variovorax brevis TaxID=3053503 RepID=UPI002576BE73|nr:6-carboxytetrahydropterin synthase [Variovorax sp. J22R133]MDM0115666.1 6-carboxytetrahydropterin synthase [Variovorax sp. J22R133]